MLEFMLSVAVGVVSGLAALGLLLVCGRVRAIKVALKKLTRPLVVYVQAKARARKLRAEARDKCIKDRVMSKMNCKKVTSGIPIFMGAVGGYYNHGSITINYKLSKGILLVDTLFHEDRHFMQDVQGKLDDSKYIECSKETMKAYRQQHVEKDARRYAYVQTVRFVKANPEGIRFLWLYKKVYHPFYGIARKIQG